MSSRSQQIRDGRSHLITPNSSPLGPTENGKGGGPSSSLYQIDKWIKDIKTDKLNEEKTRVGGLLNPITFPSSCSDAKIIHVPKSGLVISAQFDYWSLLHGSQCSGSKRSCSDSGGKWSEWMSFQFGIDRWLNQIKIFDISVIPSYWYSAVEEMPRRHLFEVRTSLCRLSISPRSLKN